MLTLHEACKSGDIDCVQSFIDSGVDIESKTIYGQTPLLLAFFGGHIDMIKLLVDSGADIEGTTSRGHTVLHYASWYEHIDIVKLLLDLGADMNTVNWRGSTPKQVAKNATIRAVFECHEQMIELREWRPWNHSKYPSMYQHIMKTLVILAKTC